MRFLKPCLDCGELSEESRCPQHTAERQRRQARGRVKSAAQRQRDAEKYGSHSWRVLSRKARRLQPFCSDCGSRDDLTCDHKVSAWERVNKGLSIRLEDVDVLCRPCNARKGSAQVGSERHGATN